MKFLFLELCSKMDIQTPGDEATEVWTKIA